LARESLYHAGRREFFVRILLGGAAAALAGCGFSPVYGTSGSVSGVADDLAAVEIGYFQNREGQILRNLLLDRFNPRGVPGRADHSLSGEISISSSSLGTQIDATTTRFQVVVRVVGTLDAFGESSPVGSRGVASYSATESPYATEVARAAALERSLTVIADDIRLPAATFFETQRRVRG
jgi:LPS-assembly lipoprotein